MKRTRYAITRIIGNELPPRDTEGSRLRVLNFIIENEYMANDAQRLWLLNRVIDKAYLIKLKKLLDLAGERYLEETIDWVAYASAHSRAEKLTVLININKARNRCFSELRQLADFIMVLDGDCFFDKEAWAKSTDFIFNDQLTNTDRKYYAHGIHRLIPDSPLQTSQSRMKLEEPIVVFRADADLLFDESLPFGQDEKQQFLIQLGLKRVGESWFQPAPDTLVGLGGFVHHLQTGSDEMESDYRERMKARNESLEILLKRADRLANLELLRHLHGLTLLKFKARQWCAILQLSSKRIRQALKRFVSRIVP
ncbi:MAG: hypothetical protein K2W95_28210 [Candidatus Obscuribacterales bacterium]|nr:hypothetical protein [Candidatus Obscuribacterales bacterium]